MWPTLCNYTVSVEVIQECVVQRTSTGHHQMQNRDHRSTKPVRLSVMLGAKNGGTNVYFQRRPGTASSILIRGLFVQDGVVIRALHGNAGAAEEDVQHQRSKQARKKG
jgi:hypothetical protein